MGTFRSAGNNESAAWPAGWLNANLRTTFEKLVRRAGLQTWPRLFQNLRASRETELVESYPIQVVASWLGNTPSVAMRHYLMTTDEHFETAIKDDRQAAQNAAQQAHAKGGSKSQNKQPAHEKTPVFPGCASKCEGTQLLEVAGTGFEPVTSRL